MAIGRKTGGRRKGTRNKRTSELQARIDASGLTPLDYMLCVMRDPDTESPRRDDMAKAAAPYVHSRLAAIEIAGDPDNPLRVERIERVVIDSHQHRHWQALYRPLAGCRIRG